jgi:hypothetical protein
MIFVEPLEKLFGLTFDCYLGDVTKHVSKKSKDSWLPSELMAW